MTTKLRSLNLLPWGILLDLVLSLQYLPTFWQRNGVVPKGDYVFLGSVVGSFYTRTSFNNGSNA
jgi:hypothetical protein